MAKQRETPPLERAARALCQLRGLPEDTRFNGAPMWHSTTFEALTVLSAALSKEELARIVPDHISPHLYDPTGSKED